MRDVPEINPSNYDHDNVCDLNAWGVEAAGYIASLENENARLFALLERCQRALGMHGPCENGSCSECRSTWKALRAALTAKPPVAATQAKETQDGK